MWGISVDQKNHWLVGQFALFLCESPAFFFVCFVLFSLGSGLALLTPAVAAGIQMGNTAVSAYIVDCYPAHAMSVVIFYSVLLNLSAFVNPFFIAPWVDNVGFTWTFATQGLVTLGVMVPVTAGLMRWGGGWRNRRGEPEWAGSA